MKIIKKKLNNGMTDNFGYCIEIMFKLIKTKKKDDNLLSWKFWVETIYIIISY
jgi:hypothetical protein